MRCLLVGPKHNGIAQYMSLLWQGLNRIGLRTDWVGFSGLCFDRDEVLRETEALARRLDPGSYDLVHVHFGMYDMEQALLLRLPKGNARWVFSAHSISGRLFAKLGDEAFQSEVERAVRKRFDHYVFFSTFGAAGFPMNEGQASVFLYPSTHQYTALTPEDDQRIRSRLNLPPTFLSLPGYPSPWKDHRTLLRALHMVEEQVDFFLAGPWWSEKVEKGMLREGPVRVRMIDRELDEMEFLCMVRGSLFGVLAYQDHPTRPGVGVVANYLWEGKACVVTDALCLPEYVGDAGIIVPQHDAEALARAISQLLRDADARHGYEKLARQRADGLLSWQTHLDQHRRLYRYVAAC